MPREFNARTGSTVSSIDSPATNRLANPADIPFFFTNRHLPFDPTGLTMLEAGGYNPLLGKAYTELGRISDARAPTVAASTGSRHGD